MRAIFGADKVHSGELILFGQTVRITHPCQAVEHGMGFATEDRKAQGLFLNQTIKDNIAIASPKRVSSNGFMKAKDLPADGSIGKLRGQHHHDFFGNA